MIPQETVSLILDTARIEDVVGDYVTLKRRGANYVACCPFHNEKTPSFYVSPSKGIYKCFGCGKSGSAVGFVMEQERSSYADALRMLARRYNIEVVEEEETAETIAARQRRESVLLVNEFAQKFYNSQLESGEGRAVGYAYFHSRGIEDETIAKFGLGWAPSGRTAFIDAATAAGYKMEYILAAGLAVQREDGGYADKFRERVMFPIHSVSGRTIAFSGRTLHADNPAKYVNTAETEVYVKGSNLLGIYFAKQEISRRDKCIIVEGNVDFVMLQQVGITNVVAPCGTALTTDQVRLIHKFTNNITLMNDGDSAGIHASMKDIELILREGLDVRVVLLPDGEDPDSFARKNGAEAVREYIETHETDFVTFKSGQLLKSAEGDPLKRSAAFNAVADTIADVADAMTRRTLIENVSEKYNLKFDDLVARVNQRRFQMKEEALKAEERARRRREAGLAAEEPAGPSGGAPDGAGKPEASATPAVIYENSELKEIEQALLEFILRFGTERLEFERDSEFYAGDGAPAPEVAGFIRDSLEADGVQFANTPCRRTYDAYMAAYDEGYQGDVILRRLFDSPDRVVAAVAAELAVEKYQITIKKFRDSMTATSSWLVASVPKTLLLYCLKRLEWHKKEISASMAGLSYEEQQPYIKDLSATNKALLEVRRHIEKYGKMN